MKLLNLGCGARTSARPEVINIDWSPYLWLKRNPLLRRIAPLLLRGEQLQRFKSISPNIMVHDLRKPLPFPNDSVDAVYHSHVLEHLDRAAAEPFLLEIKRVLRPGGIHRVVVPDFELLCRNYLNHIERAEADPAEAERHEQYIAAIIEQSVRREAFSTRNLPPARKWLMNKIFGDARRRGETHQWMYDRISLVALLTKLGFREPRICSFNVSAIPDWNSYGLDSNPDGTPAKKNSLYVEVLK
ncbi:MAG: class I SAM-dependent methyltransferase [Verrucomicrobiae bacterium]|nr:class I SAM-dependent methyltransferase [Verrucomicrobiae bacterium]MCX7722081.1 class I SAM-dependent methyltransferase [Verrucomicrobiae bacterium]MDW7980190.1 class I SAM-dependent methyltransferase [Verrucomicrobiales bacterium]